MHLGVVHEIRDPAGWDRVMSGDLNLPPGFALLGSVTQDDVSGSSILTGQPEVGAVRRV